LLDRYWKVFYANPREAYQIAELAWTVAKASHDALRIHELVVLAASHMGNAARAAGDLKHANRWFAHARDLLNGEDVRSVAVLAKVDFLEGILRKDQRRLAEAARLFTRALTLYRLVAVRLEIVRVLLSLGDTLYLVGKVKKATAQVEEALLLVDRESEPRLYLCAQHNLAFYLSEQGFHEMAAGILEAHQDLYRREGDCWTTLHLAWLWGRIHAGLGDPAKAEASFLASRAGFLAQNIAYPAALVSLDLAALYLDQQRLAEVKELAEEIIPVFQAQDIHREALAAWLVFREAARREAVDTALVRKLARYLEWSKTDPELRFDPGA
jgi:tetratricopeptide (TPR) repeat protein